MSVRNALIGGGVGVGASVVTAFGVNALTEANFARPWWQEPETVAVGVGAAAGIGALVLESRGDLDLPDLGPPVAAGYAAGGVSLLAFAALLNSGISAPRLMTRRIGGTPASAR